MKELPYLHFDSYTWKMIDLLMRLHSSEQLRFDMVVSPANVEVEASDRICLQPPLIFFGNMFHHSILCLYMLEGVPLTLMISLFFLVLIWFLYAAERMLSVKVPSKES